jgi:hypothetical protein
MSYRLCWLLAGGIRMVLLASSQYNLCILSFRHDLFAFATHGTLFCSPQIHCCFLTSQCFAGYWLLGCESVLSSRKFANLCRNQLPSLSGFQASCTEKSYFSTLTLIPFCHICRVVETWKWLAICIGHHKRNKFRIFGGVYPMYIPHPGAPLGYFLVWHLLDKGVLFRTTNSQQYNFLDYWCTQIHSWEDCLLTREKHSLTSHYRYVTARIYSGFACEWSTNLWQVFTFIIVFLCGCILWFPRKWWVKEAAVYI